MPPELSRSKFVASCRSNNLLYSEYMRIGLVCPYNYYRPGGVQTCIRELARELDARGHYVRIIAPKSRHLPDEIENNVILLGSSTELNTPFHTKADIGMAKNFEKIDQMFAEQKFDVLHIHEPGLPLLGVQLLARSPTKNIGTMHASLPGGMISKSFEKLMTPIARFIEPRLDAVTAVSEVAKNISLGYSPRLDIRVIPNGIHIKSYRPTATPKPTHKNVLFVGRLERRKGATYLLDAFKELSLQDKDLELRIVGDGHLRSRLEDRVEKEAVPNVRFYGFVSEQEKIRLLQEATIFCSPALFGESFGIVLLEAMAAGAVTVAGNNEGYVGLMTGRGAVSIVDPTNTKMFAARLSLLLNDAHHRGLWLDWAHDFVKEYDYASVTDQYEKLYKKVIRK